MAPPLPCHRYYTAEQSKEMQGKEPMTNSPLPPSLQWVLIGNSHGGTIIVVIVIVIENRHPNDAHTGFVFPPSSSIISIGMA